MGTTAATMHQETLSSDLQMAFSGTTCAMIVVQGMVMRLGNNDELKSRKHLTWVVHISDCAFIKFRVRCISTGE